MKENLFSYSVSVAEYDRNKNEKDTYKIKWTEKEGSITTLCNDISNNLAFCPCFYHNGDTFTNRDKSDNNIKSTHFIIFDMDAVKLTASDFYTIMQSTEIPPTIVYTTANNGKFKPNKNEEYNNRYRVIYALDTPIYNATYYKEIHQALKSEICVTIDDNNIYNDNSDSSVSHFYAGCRGGEIYSSDNVISLRWLNDRYSLNVESNIKVHDRYIIKQEEGGQCGYIISHNNNGSSNKNNHYNLNNDINKHGNYILYLFNNKHNNLDNDKVHDSDIIKKREEHYISTMHKLENNEFINDYYNESINDLLCKYISVYPSYEFTNVEYSDDDLYYIVPENYIEIKRKWHYAEVEKDNGDYYRICEIEKCKDGQRRRKRLFINLILRRLIYPQISFEHLLFNACYELKHYIDNVNTNDRITKYELAEIAVNAYYENMDKWQNLKNYHKPKYKINKAYCLANNLNARREAVKVRGLLNQKAKNEKWCKIDKLYNIAKSDKENLEIINNNGIEIKMRGLQQYKKDRGLTRRKKSKEVSKQNNKNKNANKAIESDNNKIMEQQHTNDKKASQGANVAIVEVNKESAQNNIKVMLDGTMREITINDVRSELFGGSLLTLTNNIIGVRAYELDDDLKFTMAVINSDLKPSYIVTNKKDDVICFYALDSELDDNDYKTISNEICKELKGCINENTSERIVSLVNGYEYKKTENFGCIANDIIFNTQWLINRYSIITESNEKVRDGYIISHDDDEVNNYSPTYYNNDFWNNKDVLI